MHARVCVDLEVTGGVDEQVGGLQVAVQHVGRVDVLQASQDLVEEVADVVVAQPLGLQQLVEVRLHQSLHDVAEGGGSRTTTADQSHDHITHIWDLMRFNRDPWLLIQWRLMFEILEWVQYIYVRLKG